MRLRYSGKSHKNPKKWAVRSSGRSTSREESPCTSHGGMALERKLVFFRVTLLWTYSGHGMPTCLIWPVARGSLTREEFVRSNDPPSPPYPALFPSSLIPLVCGVIMKRISACKTTRSFQRGARERRKLILEVISRDLVRHHARVKWEKMTRFEWGALIAVMASPLAWDPTERDLEN